MLTVGIFLDLLMICIFRRELSPARRRRAIIKKAFSLARGNGINGNNTQLYCSQEILVYTTGPQLANRTHPQGFDIGRHRRAYLLVLRSIAITQSDLLLWPTIN